MTAANLWFALLFLAAALPSSASEPLVLRNQVERTLASVGEAAVPQLIAALDSGDRERRRSAARILSFFEDGDPASVQSLTQALQSDDAVVRQFAALGLGRRGEFAGEAVPALVRQARQDPNRDARRHAILALGNIGQPKGETIPALLAALQSEDAEIREAGIEALTLVVTQSMPVISALGERLGDRDESPMVRKLAVAALVRYGDQGLREIAQRLQSLSSELRMHFVQELGLVDVPSPIVEKVLIASLDDPDPIVRRHATISLGAVSERSPEAYKALTEMLRDDRIDVRRAASRALRRTKGASHTHVVKLLADTSDPVVTVFALRALRHDEVLETLVEPIAAYLNSEDAEVRQAAVEVLGYLAEKSDLAFEVLRDAATHDKRVSPEAISALSRLEIRRADAEASLRRLLVEGETWRRAHALEAFTAAGKPLTDLTKQVVVRLLDDSSHLVAERAARLAVSSGVGWKEGAKVALEHDDAAVRRSAIDSLADPALAELVAPSVLLGYLRGQNVRYATLAARALGAKNEAQSLELEALQETFKQSTAPALAEASLRTLLELGLLKTDDVLDLIDESLQAETAIRVLAGRDFDVDRAVQVLIQKLLSEDNLQTRIAASELLGRLGKASVAELRPLLRQEDQLVLELALNAVRLNGPAAAEAVTDLIALLDE